MSSKTTIREHFQVNKEAFDTFFCKTLALSATSTPKQRIQEAHHYIQLHHLHYPLILKPNDGVGGLGLLFIQNTAELNTALQTVQKDYILQEYIPRPLELSVFFVKHPGKP
ncbi:MAG: ATP-grasp domain-containing protein [bacterium]